MKRSSSRRSGIWTSWSVEKKLSTSAAQRLLIRASVKALIERSVMRWDGFWMKKIFKKENHVHATNFLRTLYVGVWRVLFCDMFTNLLKQEYIVIRKNSTENNFIQGQLWDIWWRQSSNPVRYRCIKGIPQDKDNYQDFVSCFYLL